MERYLQDLNEQQYAAVCYDGGPSLVIAGAGSGKTRVLTNKITYLIEHGYDPRRILALTFTNKAAAEMRERIGLLMGESVASQLWMGTFHSMFLRILRFNSEKIGFNSNFTIYDTTDTKSVLKQVIKDMELDEKDYPVNVVASVISNAKNSLMSPADYLRERSLTDRDRYAKRPALGDIYMRYWNKCYLSSAMDFDDILFYTNILFRDHEDVLKKYQEFFQYILVDEYQDTNFAQHLVVSQLSKEHRRICVVGDDAQSIYSFRGANIQNILNLSKYYPDLRTFKLEQNYRSTQNILNVANSLIEKNKQQIRKRIFSDNQAGCKVPVIEAYTDYEESHIVANKIAEMKMLQAGSYSDFAVLYRTNAQSRLLEESLRKRNVPYRVYGGQSFYQRKEIKDALGYFRLTVNPNDDEALRRIINYPARGIGEKTVQKIRLLAAKEGVSMWTVVSAPDRFMLDVNSGTKKKLEGFRDLVESYIQMNDEGVDAFVLAGNIFTTSHILSSLMSENTPENISRQENLSELLSATKQFVEERQERGETLLSMSDFLSEVSLATDQDMEDDDDTPRVTLMTVHAAKGLEFRNVFIVGVEDDLFPSARSANNLQEVEEERRLLYVAITRAKENCVMLYCRSRYLNGMSRPCGRSRFLKDIDSNLLIETSVSAIKTGRDYYSPKERARTNITMEARQPSRLRPLLTKNNQLEQPVAQPVKEADGLNVGVRISHSLFGAGTIEEVEYTPDKKIKVRFENVGTKVLLVKFAKITILG